MKLVEVSGDIFKSPKEYWIVHCISRDCEMGAGLALQIRQKYPLLKPHIIERLGLFPKSRVLSYISDERKIFNLITKDKFYNKPTYESIRLALYELSLICRNLKIQYLTMPYIGCGLDKKDWSKVKPIIQDVFKDIDIEILIVNYKR